MELSLQTIEALIKLVSDHKLDSLELGELKITKTLHEVKEGATPIPFTPSKMTDEEILFLAGAGELPPELVEAFIRPRRRTTEGGE